jgi:ribosomal-protein-alanine N-acetyltransferase
MQVEDAAYVFELEKRIFKDAWSLQSFLNEIKDFRISYPFVLTLETKIVGYAVVLYLADEIHINNFAVVPEQRGKGLGIALMNHILEKFPEHQEAFLEVRQSNKVAIELYKKFNFEQIYLRPNYYADGEHAIVMRRNSAGRKR